MRNLLFFLLSSTSVLHAVGVFKLMFKTLSIFAFLYACMGLKNEWSVYFTLQHGMNCILFEMGFFFL